MQPIPTSARLLFVVVAWVPLLGCQHAAVRTAGDLGNALHSVAPEDLFEIGLLQAQRGDLLRSEQYLTAALHRGYDEPTVVYWLVRVCVAAGRYHSALDHAVRHLRNDPGNWRLRLIVASIHEALGELDGARRELEHIVSSEPTTPLPRYRLAMLYLSEESGARRAAPHFEAYLTLDPQGDHAAEVERLLAQTNRRTEQSGEGAPPVPVGVREVIR